MSIQIITERGFTEIYSKGVFKLVMADYASRVVKKVKTKENGQWKIKKTGYWDPRPEFALYGGLLRSYRERGREFLGSEYNYLHFELPKDNDEKTPTGGD